MNRPLTVLIVEDDPSTAQALATFLQTDPAGITVLHAATLAESLQLVARASVIVLDLNLPDASSFDALRATRRLAPSVPIVVVTGDETLELASIQRGADEFLAKPVSREALLHSVRRSVLRKEFDEAALRVCASFDVTQEAVRLAETLRKEATETVRVEAKRQEESHH